MAIANRISRRFGFTGISPMDCSTDPLRYVGRYCGTIILIELISAHRAYPKQGYSYGSLIASLHPVLPELQVSHVLISYPLGPRHWLTAFHGKTYTEELNTLLRDPRSNVLVLYGDQDDFTSVENYEQWVKKLQCELDREAKLQIVKVENASHFWRERGAASRLLAALEAWLSL
ncbi:uncharacterized protein FIBRA_01316 [Fibroporia radiculosa]|uniref:Peptidase S9 prolyl oligopeptidase catalytic domain-containing protein n=1 Tax=Fibroporia radiculosa TaxID=599839 RepID=J4GJU7_9APHY|nr:uncharacterized protein FIBRA_01316 [Fibroporia radiculosa]CCL99300.1 predicted protein [Fibroporia radiculosa]